MYHFVRASPTNVLDTILGGLVGKNVSIRICRVRQSSTSDMQKNQPRTNERKEKKSEQEMDLAENEM